MITKTSLALAALNRGDVKEALKIVKTFKIGYTRQERETISRGYDCLVHPTFYQQLGTDCVACIQAATEIVRAKLIQPTE